MSDNIKAIQVTKENIPYILKYATSLGFNLDYINDNMEYYAETYGWKLYLITDGTNLNNNVVFTTFGEPDFHLIWKFSEPEDNTKFVPIEMV